MSDVPGDGDGDGRSGVTPDLIASTYPPSRRLLLPAEPERAGGRAWSMTSQFTAPSAFPTSSTARPPTFGRGGLTAGDAKRIAAAIDAELADSTRTACLRVAGVGSLVPQARRHRAAGGPEALAAYLAERAESGICFGTSMCLFRDRLPTSSGRPDRPNRRRPRATRPAWPAPHARYRTQPACAPTHRRRAPPHPLTDIDRPRDRGP